MDTSTEFYKGIVDSLSEQIAIIRSDGTLQFVNRAWAEAADGGGEAQHWIGGDYFDLCGRGVLPNPGPAALEDLRRVMDGETDSFAHDYAFPPQLGQRWVHMRVDAMGTGRERYFVIVQQDITDRRRAEQRLQRLSYTDALTGVANRRYLDRFLSREMRRAARHGASIALILFDIDHFKQFNDVHGHVRGDECLQRVAQIISAHARRAGDLCARYGGEEFALVLTATSERRALHRAERVLEALRAEAIPHGRSVVADCVTASAGVAVCTPGKSPDIGALLHAADQALYAAKQGGRNHAVPAPVGAPGAGGYRAPAHPSANPGAGA